MGVAEDAGLPGPLPSYKATPCQVSMHRRWAQSDPNLEALLAKQEPQSCVAGWNEGQTTQAGWLVHGPRLDHEKFTNKANKPQKTAETIAGGSLPGRLRRRLGRGGSLRIQQTESKSGSRAGPFQQIACCLAF